MAPEFVVVLAGELVVLPGAVLTPFDWVGPSFWATPPGPPLVLLPGSVLVVVPFPAAPGSTVDTVVLPGVTFELLVLPGCVAVTALLLPELAPLEVVEPLPPWVTETLPTEDVQTPFEPKL